MKQTNKTRQSQGPPHPLLCGLEQESGTKIPSGEDLSVLTVKAQVFPLISTPGWGSLGSRPTGHLSCAKQVAREAAELTSRIKSPEASLGLAH